LFSKELIRKIGFFLNVNCGQLNHFAHKGVIRLERKKRQHEETLCCGPLVLHVCIVGAPPVWENFR